MDDSLTSPANFTVTEIYLHIGLPKTGTTFLQRQIFPNLDGIFDVYNEAPEVFSWIRDALETTNTEIERSGLMDRIQRRLAVIREDKILISHENISGNGVLDHADIQLRAERLKELFPAAKIIVTLRRQADFIESLYKQSLHNFWSIPVSDFLIEDQSRPPPPINQPHVKLSSTNWRALVRAFATAFGQENVLILVYEELNKDRRRFLDTLYAFLGVAPYFPDAVGSHNKSYSALSCRLAYFLNRFVRSDHQPRGIIVIRPFFEFLLSRRERNIIYRLLCGLSRRIDLRWFLQNVIDRIQYRSAHLLDEKRKERIKEFHAEDNRQLDNEYNLGLGRYGYF